MHVSVILTTFNRAGYLALSLPGYMRQTYKDFELIIADDGSTDETQGLIERYQRLASFPISHVWQENKGYRRARILNEAIKQASYDYLIFSDGDCIPKGDFIEAHVRNSQEGYLLGGGHIRLTKEYSASLTPEAVSQGLYGQALTSEQLWRLRLKQWKNFFYMLAGKRRRPKFIGLNLSVDKPSVLAINGFDENYEGWGQEDSDLRERLKRFGLRPRSILTQAIVFHLYHEPHPTKAVRPNLAYSRRPDIPVRCINGLEKLTGVRD
jgi:glycosyltransferase involved in cell wall biosynthesis